MTQYIDKSALVAEIEIAFSGNPIGSANLIDWLNKKMFAYRTIDDKDMFELGLAIKVTEYNNPYD